MISENQDFIRVSQDQAYIHSLRVFRSISSFLTEPQSVSIQLIATDIMVLAIYMLQKNEILLAAPEQPADAGDDQVFRDMCANLIAAAQLVNPDGPPLAAESSGAPRGVAIQMALKIILAWLKEQGIEDIVAWIIKNIK